MLGFKNVAEELGGKSPKPHMENMRARMYGRATEWLLKGGIPADDEELAQQLGFVAITSTAVDGWY